MNKMESLGNKILVMVYLFIQCCKRNNIKIENLVHLMEDAHNT